MLKGPALKQLDDALETVEYSCGAVLSLFVDDEAEEADDHPLKSVFVRADLSCSEPVEIPYYSSGAFPRICSHCATSEDLKVGAGTEGFYPMCSACFEVKPKLPERKRKLFSVSAE